MTDAEIVATAVHILVDTLYVLVPIWVAFACFVWWFGRHLASEGLAQNDALKERSLLAEEMVLARHDVEKQLGKLKRQVAAGSCPKDLEAASFSVGKLLDQIPADNHAMQQLLEAAPSVHYLDVIDGRRPACELREVIDLPRNGRRPCGP